VHNECENSVLENFPTFGTERNQKNRVVSSTYSFSFKYAAIIISTSVISFMVSNNERPCIFLKKLSVTMQQCQAAP